MQLRELFCLLCSTNRRPDALSASWSQLWWIMVYTLLLLAASYIHGLWIDPIMYLEICPNIGHILRTKYLNYAVEELWFVHNRNIAIVYKPSMKFQLKESHNVVQIKYTWNSSWKGSHNTATQLQVREEPESLWGCCQVAAGLLADFMEEWASVWLHRKVLASRQEVMVWKGIWSSLAFEELG